MGNKFIFYVDHMALDYLVNIPQVLRKIIKWLLLFVEYDFTIMISCRNPNLGLATKAKELARLRAKREAR
jgi:hypothetical protein